MAEWTCRACTARYAVGAPACPQCGSTDRAEDRVLNLPTIRVACAWDGCRYCGTERTVRLRPVGVGLVEMPTLLCAGCGVPPVVVSLWPPTPEQEEDDVPKIHVHRDPTNAADPPDDPAAGEGESSPGTSSSTSSATGQTSPEQSEQPLPKRAPRTGSRSRKAQTDSSSAPSTDGDPTAATSGKDSEAAE